MTIHVHINTICSIIVAIHVHINNFTGTSLEHRSVRSWASGLPLHLGWVLWSMFWTGCGWSSSSSRDAGWIAGLGRPTPLPFWDFHHKNVACPDLCLHFIFRACFLLHLAAGGDCLLRSWTSSSTDWPLLVPWCLRLSRWLARLSKTSCLWRNSRIPMLIFLDVKFNIT